MIAPARSAIIDLFQVALRNSTRGSAPDKFKAAVAEYGEVPDVLSAIIFGKRQELCKYLTHKVFCQTTDSVLLDYNFNIETIISSDSYAKVNEQLLNVELILQNEDKLRRVTIEMNLVEANEFLSKLQTIESELITASKVEAVEAE